MNLNKDVSSWCRVDPATVLNGSRVQAENVLKMAIEDIERQDAEIGRLTRLLRKHGVRP